MPVVCPDRDLAKASRLRIIKRAKDAPKTAGSKLKLIDRFDSNSPTSADANQDHGLGSRIRAVFSCNQRRSNPKLQGNRSAGRGIQKLAGQGWQQRLSVLGALGSHEKTAPAVRWRW